MYLVRSALGGRLLNWGITQYQPLYRGNTINHCVLHHFSIYTYEAVAFFIGFALSLLSRSGSYSNRTSEYSHLDSLISSGEFFHYTGHVWSIERWADHRRRSNIQTSSVGNAYEWSTLKIMPHIVGWQTQYNIKDSNRFPCMVSSVFCFFLQWFTRYQWSTTKNFFWAHCRMEAWYKHKLVRFFLVQAMTSMRLSIACYLLLFRKIAVAMV